MSSMKSPRWLSSSSPIGVSRLIGSLAIFSTLRTFSSGMASFSASSSGRRLAADLVQHLAAGADDLVDRLDHVHGDADGARLVGDRAGDRLADPPGGVGRELVAAAVLELVDRLHQADVAFLDQVEELQAAVGVFLGDRDDEAQVGLDHFLLGLTRLALALLHHLDELRNSWISRPVSVASAWISARISLIWSLSLATKSFQPRVPSLETRSSHFGSSSEFW